jgi:peptidoglycan/LPS O-acetylase OafA/YrhL
MEIKQQQIHSLTGLRLIAALMVMVGHSSTVLPQWWLPKAFVGLAATGMMLFFVLSGFVIWLNYAESICTRRPGALREFAVARFARLYPMYAVMLVLAFVLTEIIHGSAAVEQMFPGAFSFFFALQAWIPIDPFHHRLVIFTIPYMVHLWSISTEFFFYACFSAIVLLLSGLRTPRSILMGGVFICVVTTLAVYLCLRYRLPITKQLVPGVSEVDGTMWLTYYSPYLRVLQFLAGCSACQLYLSLEASVPRKMEARSVHISAAVAVMIVAATVILFSTSVLPSSWYLSVNVSEQVVPVASMAFLMLYVSRYPSVMQRFLSLPKMVVFGDASYSMYLLHPFSIDILRKATLGVFLSWGAGGHLIFMVLVAGSVALVSMITYRLVEAPARRFLRRGFSMGNNVAVAELHTAKA